jgi:hypothetical protein
MSMNGRTFSPMPVSAANFRLAQLVSRIIAERMPEVVSASINTFDFQHHLLNESCQSPLAFSRFERWSLSPRFGMTVAVASLRGRKKLRYDLLHAIAEVYQSA